MISKRKTFTSIAVSKQLAEAIAGSENVDQTFREALTSHLARTVEEKMLQMKTIPREIPKEAPPWDVQKRTEIGDYGEITDLFCPYCGTRGLLVEPGDGDFYVGPTYWCRPPAGCNELFTMG